MLILVIYDIPHDRTRVRISDTCLDYGLERIQYSSFLGNLSRTNHEELLLRLKRLLGKKEGVIQSFNLCQSCWAEHKKLGKAIAPSTIRLNLETNVVIAANIPTPKPEPANLELLLNENLEE